MQSQSDPERTQIDNQVVVHLQRFNCCAPRGSQTNEARPIGAPLKMLRPFLPAWMEEIDQAAGDGITGFGDLPLVAVASAASQAQIGDDRFAAARRGDDVIGFERHAQQFFRAVAVGAKQFDRFRA